MRTVLPTQLMTSVARTTRKMARASSMVGCLREEASLSSRPRVDSEGHGRTRGTQRPGLTSRFGWQSVSCRSQVARAVVTCNNWER